MPAESFYWVDLIIALSIPLLFVLSTGHAGSAGIHGCCSGPAVESAPSGDTVLLHRSYFSSDPLYILNTLRHIRSFSSTSFIVFWMAAYS